MRHGLVMVAISWVILACTGEAPAPQPLAEEGNPFATHPIGIYDSSASWLCHPELSGADDACTVDLDTTVVFADGTTEILSHTPVDAPAADCFYVYPTISLDLQGNSDLDAGGEERFVIQTQAARYSGVCRVIVPVYRQMTLAALRLGIGEPDPELAYADIQDAFQTYLGRLGEGRGFVLVGHSQGTDHLVRLLEEVVEPEPFARDRLIAAHLIGSAVDVPVDVDAPALRQTPLCGSDRLTGCIVSYASFRYDGPPAPGDRFGASNRPGTVPACVNPADLGGGPALLTNHSPTVTLPAFAAEIGEPPSPFADPNAFPPITTPFVQMPGLLSASCVTTDEVSYLSIEVLADPDDPRADDIGGDSDPGWGLHLADVALAQGDLVALAGEQIAAWTDQNGQPPSP